MNAYTPVESRLRAMLTSADISRIFQREPGWFDRDRVRKALYAKGFPHPAVNGLWSPYAVRQWQMTIGQNPDAVPPNVERRKDKPRARRTRRGRNGYAAL
jgi:hypothetical protein